MGPPEHLWELPLASAEPEYPPAGPEGEASPAGAGSNREGMVPGLFKEDRWGIPIP